MMEKIIHTLERANKRYNAYYKGGVMAHIRRLLRYPIKYIRRALVRESGMLAKNPVPVSTCWGDKIFVFLPDKNAGSLYYFGVLPKLEHPLSLYLAKALKAKDVFYDVGANYGFFSLLAGAFIAEGEVHAFEPHPLLSECLRKSLSKKSHLNQVALYDKTTQTFFYDSYSLRHSGGSTIMKKVGESGKIPLAKFAVQTISLDDYILNNRPPTFIKIDAEGAEYFILKGGIETLKKHRPKIILEIWGQELWGEYSKPSVDLLYEAGYSANEISEQGELISISRLDLEKKSLVLKYINIVFI